jgi:methionyl-tRNA synthetase
VHNSDLANTFGNSVSRVTNMIGKYFDAKTPKRQDATGVISDDPSDQLDIRCQQMVELFAQPQGLGLRNDPGLGIVKDVDGYIEATSPFKLAKDPEKMPEVGTILYNCAEALRIASVLLWPFIPEACEKFWSRIGCDYAQEMEADGGRGKLEQWVQWGQLEPGTPIEKGEALFPRYQVPKS